MVKAGAVEESKRREEVVSSTIGTVVAGAAETVLPLFPTSHLPTRRSSGVTPVSLCP